MNMVATPAAEFAAALLDPRLPSPSGLRSWNGSDPARRLAVYRNNVICSLVDALSDSFPVTQQLVGEDFFRAMAATFVRRHPPSSCVLAHYGEGYPRFIADFELAAGLPYLPDLARLEWLRLQALHAADAAPVSQVALAAVLADPTRLAGLVLHWHPSMALLASAHAVVSLWAAHQTEGEMPSVDISRSEQAAVLRDGWEVLLLPLEPAAAAFLGASLLGEPLGAAAAAGAALDAQFDLGRALARLLQHQALVAFTFV